MVQTTLIPIAQIAPNTGQIPDVPKNPRFIRDERYRALQKSIAEFPEMLELRELIVFPVADGYVTIAGNMRYRAMKDAGYTEAPCKVLPASLAAARLREIAIKDNIPYGTDDTSILQDFWNVEELKDWGVELADWGVSEAEAVEDDYEAPADIQTDIVVGDLFEIGEHRLLCGDSTDSDAVARLMNGEKADMVFTDPPYGNGSSGKYGRGQLGIRTIESDENFDCVNDFFNLRMCDKYVFFLQWRTFKEAIQTLENNELKLKTIAVWDKKNAGLNGGGGMAEQWEAIIVAGNIKYSRFGGNVFSISREQKKRIDSPHPHQKPIELLSNLLGYFQEYNLLLDPFLGSGSTMVAAHQLKRRCFGMEIEPKYCQVIIDRMKKLAPDIVITRNGVKQ